MISQTFPAVRAVRTLILCAGVGFLALVSGCADKRGGKIPYSPANFGAPDAPTVMPLGTGYKIAPLDTLSIKVFKMPDLSGDFEVDLTGQISLPLIGSVTATDYTTAQLDEQLTKKWGAKYLENPDITVGIKSSTRRSVTVDGAVKRAGGFPVNGPVTLLQAIAQAGGTSEDANVRRVAIFRQIEGRRQAAAFDLASIRRGEMEDPQVYAGDIVIVDGSAIKALQKTILSTLPVVNRFIPF